MLLERPIVSARDVAERLGVTLATAGNQIDLLVRMSVLKEKTNQLRNRAFAYEDLINILAEGTSPDKGLPEKPPADSLGGE